MHLAILLRDARRRAGLKQVDLARRLERSQAYVSKYEQGSRKLTLDEVADISGALDLPLMPFLESWVAALNKSEP